MNNARASIISDNIIVRLIIHAFPDGPSSNRLLRIDLTEEAKKITRGITPQQFMHDLVQFDNSFDTPSNQQIGKPHQFYLNKKMIEGLQGSERSPVTLRSKDELWISYEFPDQRNVVVAKAFILNKEVYP